MWKKMQKKVAHCAEEEKWSCRLARDPILLPDVLFALGRFMMIVA
jgi:hypothetical protein